MKPRQLGFILILCGSFSFICSMVASGQFNINDRALEVGTRVPTGTIMPFAGETAPSGYFLCDGSAVSRTTYTNLHAALKDVGGVDNYGWGNGDGSTTFNVPDLRGRYLRGAGAPGDGNGGDTVALSVFADGGSDGNGMSVSGSYATSAHTHNQGSMEALIGRTATTNLIGMETSQEGSYTPTSGLYNSYLDGGGSPIAWFANGNQTFNATTDVIGNTGASSTNSTPSLSSTFNETRPKSYAVNYIIKI